MHKIRRTLYKTGETLTTAIISVIAIGIMVLTAYAFYNAWPNSGIGLITGGGILALSILSVQIRGHCQHKLRHNPDHCAVCGKHLNSKCKASKLCAGCQF